MSGEPARPELAALVRPGDKLVIGTPLKLSHGQVEEARQRLGRQLPGVDMVLITECTGLAVYREEPQT